ncbi:response regulator [Candidatus Woesearchaeota archaeon]|nr:response regulator [Candidatus Woesearchaeota archaeon]
MVKKILVVDDKTEDLDTMKTLLEKNGYKVAVALDGTKALEILRKNSFDLILIDVLMPKLSGYDLLRLVREKLNHGIIMVYISIVPRQEVDMTDVDGFIQKPFSPKSFLNEIKKALLKFGRNKK